MSDYNFPAKSMRKKGVNWFSPLVLIKEGLQTLKATTIGEQVDTRELQGIGNELKPSKKAEFDEDFSKHNKELFFDFVADTGEGWSATYSIASLLSRDWLNLGKGAQKVERGRFLIFGGDLVYPHASDTEYRNRLKRPFEAATAWRSDDKELQMFAIPGNHDWYDGLGAFRARFCNTKNPRKLGPYLSKQKYSYFALKLPHNWFIFGIDLGLQFSWDNHQFNYFSAIIEQLPAKSKIILVTSEPEWVYGGIQNPNLSKLLNDFEERLKSVWSKKHRRSKEHPRVRLYLSGDIHN